MSINIERMRKHSTGSPFSDRQLREFPPEEKRRIIEAMGFTPLGSDHTYDCPRVFDSGNRCNCAGDPTMWVGPKDVQEMMGDTWEQRVAKRRGK